MVSNNPEPRKLISIVTPCYNEEKNIQELYERIKKVFENLKDYDYEHILIDNASTDNTVKVIDEIAAKDKNVKYIVNSRNFGHIRSPYHGLLQAKGDAAMLMVSDLQDPPELIPQFITKWEAGNQIVLGVKKTSKESPLMFAVRKTYYNLIDAISTINHEKNYTGFGLYDKRIVEILRDIQDPYPYFRGLILELGFNVDRVYYEQPRRKRGLTKNNLLTLYDMAMLGICSYSRVPMRLATIAGFALSVLSLLIAILFLILKLIFWHEYMSGLAPLVIGLFFLGSVQLFFIGLLGEYIGFIATKNSKFPIVIEKYRKNFE
ncbi:MAG TPA: glycosyltransferase [Lentisphaeria bacterium]|nr:MAG: dolichol monophosphate mannose synthase [Lentisphaerae bacterium GWF2_38_69]HBM16415.1 glycosyltransferase [Lentisphaeria bacterium]